MEKRELSVGVYEATPAFRAIESHSCVCYKDDMGLVAVVGPAEDRESQEYADLFAVSPELVEALKNIAEITHDSNAITDHSARYAAFKLAADVLTKLGYSYAFVDETEPQS